MKFKPILGSDLSGHIGGVVASHNTYGPYFRQRVRPVNAKTPAQQSQRAAIAGIAQTWRTLDPTLQNSWRAATVVKTSRKGDRVNLTGQAAFQFVNTLRLRAGIALVTTPPTGTPSATMTLPVVGLTTAVDLQVTFGADLWNDPAGAIVLSAALLTSRGIAFRTPNLAVDLLVNPGTSPVSVALPFAIPVGARARVEFHATQPDGRQTTYRTVDVLNVAFPPTPPIGVHVVEVVCALTNFYVWTFDGPITVSGGPSEPALIVDGDTSGLITQAGPNSVGVHYTTADGTPHPWSIPSLPATIAPAVVFPQSGSTP
jgi:hypothetical protein